MLPFSYPTSAEGWQNISLILTVIAFTLAFAGAAANAALTWRANKAKKEESRLKDEQIALEFKAKDVLIASADKRAAEANAEAAKANEGLAKSSEEIARSTAETEQAKLERAEADKQIAVAKANAASAAERTAEISLKVEEEARKRAEAQRALLELQERIRPRLLTAQQREQLINLLKSNTPKASVSIACILGDTEGFAFASQLDEVLKASGWTTSGVGQGVYTGNNPVGLHIIVHSAKTAPFHAGFLQHAFGAIGFPLQGMEDAGIQQGQVQLLVGRKP